MYVFVMCAFDLTFWYFDIYINIIVFALNYNRKSLVSVYMYTSIKHQQWQQQQNKHNFLLNLSERKCKKAPFHSKSTLVLT